MDIQQALPWINRIGIILNFISGFLIAPELIGIPRIRKFEEFLTKIAENTYSFSTIFLDPTLHWRLPTHIKQKTLLIIHVPIALFDGYLIFIVGIANIIDFISSNLFLYLSIRILTSVFYVTISYTNNHFYMSKVQKIALITVGFMINLIFLLIPGLPILNFIIILLYVTVFIFIPSLLHSLTSQVLKRLEGDDRVRGYLVSFGVALFILGNLFQLIGTF